MTSPLRGLDDGMTTGVAWSWHASAVIEAQQGHSVIGLSA
jgi:hypothetical protein